jgi:hypothetical protein
LLAIVQSCYSILHDCTIANNQATYGGGVAVSILYNCTLANNSALAHGGGAMYCDALYNCLLVGNTAQTELGGGAFGRGNLYNCTIVGNSTPNRPAGGGGVYSCTLHNCISWGNSVPDSEFTAEYSCGVGYSGNHNTNANPLFADAAAGNYRLSAHSPCHNTGMNGNWTTAEGAVDLDGGPRILDGTVDMGAYELFVARGTVIGVR